MSFSSRFTPVLVSVMATITLSACQPETETYGTAAEEDVAPNAVEIKATEIEGEDMAEESKISANANANANAINNTQVTEDYTKAMTRMTDEIMIGIAYNSPDTAFAKSMLGLHRGAISMAELELKYGVNDELRLIAQEIINSQQQNIDILNKWLASHPDAASPKPNTRAMQQAYAEIVASMNYKIRVGTNALETDLAFARGILPHQLAVVDLAKEQLRYGTDEDMRRLAVQLVNTQAARLKPLQTWLTANDTAFGNEKNLEPEPPLERVEEDLLTETLVTDENE